LPYRRETGTLPAHTLFALAITAGALTTWRTLGNEMATANYLPEVLDTTEADRLATGFIFTEGPLWHPDGFWYFVDLRRNHLHRLTPGKEPELVRTTIGGNGTTFDLQGRLIVCEGDDRRLTRMGPDGKVETLVDNYRGGRFNRPNDVICHSNGCIYFTDPDKRRPYHEREIPGPTGENNLGRP
jgi:gluconolactonase